MVVVPIVFTAIALLPELTVPAPSNNDDATHFLLIQRASDALARGENPLDFWVPQLELGLPWFIYYQPLPSLVVVALHRALLGAVDLLTVFNAVRYALLVGFPLAVLWSLRRMGVPTAGAVVAAAVSPLLSGDFRYGFDYDSYIWRGFGLFTQLAAMPLCFVTLALLWRAIEPGHRSRIAWAALALSALVMTHFIYSYMMAIIAAVLVVAGARSRDDLLRRAVRLCAVGAPAAVATSWIWVPFITERAYLNVSPYLQAEKFDSYGAPTILGWLVTGDLLDHGRWPTITALLGLGLIAALVTRTPLARTALAGFVVSLILYFGRPTLDGLVSLIPMHEGLLLHRFIGSVELFAIVLVGIGAGWAFERVGSSSSPTRFAIAAAAVVLLLVPAMNERASFYSLNSRWMRQTVEAINADADARTILAAIRAQPAGRVFAGLRDGDWATGLDFGIPFNSVKFSDYLVFNAIPVVAAPYSSLSLNSDLVWDFAIGKREEYDLLDARYVVAPSAAAVPDFLQALQRTQRYTLYRAPTSGGAVYGALSDRQLVRTQSALFSINRPWFNGADVAALRFHRFDFPSVTGGASAGKADGCAQPTYSGERIQPGRLDLSVGCPNASTLVLKVTYHPNWHVIVDGLEVPAFMTSPSYLGVALPAGQHIVTAEYRSTPIKTPLFFVGVLALISLGVVARRSSPILGLRAALQDIRALPDRFRSMTALLNLDQRVDLARASVVVIALRIGLGALGLASVLVHPRDWATVPMNPPGLAPLLLSQSSPLWPLVGPWQRFDALWYEFIASRGYGQRGPEAAFAPLYPGLEHVIGSLIGGSALAGLLISTAAFVIGLVLLKTLVARDFGTEVAQRAVLYLALAPTAFFFLAGYPEALFLALTAGTFLAARSGRLLLAGSLVAVAILCRNQGVFLLAPLGVECLLWLRANPTRVVTPAAAVLIPIGIYGVYYLWLRGLGFNGGMLEVQEVYWRSTFGHPIEALTESVRVVTSNLSAAPYELLNLAAVLALAGSIVAMFKLRFPLSYTAYAGASLFGMLWRYSAFTPLMSADRFLVVVFPFFVVLAVVGKTVWVRRPVLALSLLLLAALFVRYTQYEFVG